MAGESDQTKWVGVRPTDPAVAIPVTLTDPITSVFTKKAAPAILDLQAVSAMVRFTEEKNNIGAPNYNHDIYTVPAGKLFMLNFIQGMSYQATPTTIQFQLVSGGTAFPWNIAAYGGAYATVFIFQNVLYDEDEIVRIRWITTLAATDVVGWIFGYLMNKY